MVIRTLTKIMIFIFAIIELYGCVSMESIPTLSKNMNNDEFFSKFCGRSCWFDTVVGETVEVEFENQLESNFDSNKIRKDEKTNSIMWNISLGVYGIANLDLKNQTINKLTINFGDPTVKLVDFVDVLGYPDSYFVVSGKDAGDCPNWVNIVFLYDDLDYALINGECILAKDVKISSDMVINQLIIAPQTTIDKAFLDAFQQYLEVGIDIDDLKINLSEGDFIR